MFLVKLLNSLLKKKPKAPKPVVVRPPIEKKPEPAPWPSAISQAGLDLIKHGEGLRLEAYPDPATGGEPWTIGYGHTSAAGAPKVVPGLKITLEEAEAILRSDCKKFEAALNKAVKVRITQNQYDALMSFVFNVGPANLLSSTLLKLLNNGDYQGAAAQFDRWNKAAGKEMPGLTARRNLEEQLFRKGM